MTNILCDKGIVGRMGKVFLIWDKNYNDFVEFVYEHVRRAHRRDDMEFHAFTTAKIEDKSRPCHVPWIQEHQCLTEASDGPETNLVSYIMRNVVGLGANSKRKTGKEPHQRKQIILVQTKEGQHEELQIILSGIDEFAKENEVRLYRMEKQFQSKEETQGMKGGYNDGPNAANHAQGGGIKRPSYDVFVHRSYRGGTNDSDGKSDSSAKEDYREANAGTTPRSGLSNDAQQMSSTLCPKCLLRLKGFILEHDEAEKARRSWPSSKRGYETDRETCHVCAGLFNRERIQRDGSNLSFRLNRFGDSSKGDERLHFNGCRGNEGACILCSEENSFKNEGGHYSKQKTTRNNRRFDEKCSCEGKLFMCTRCFLNSLASKENENLWKGRRVERTNLTTSDILDPRPGSAPAQLQLYKNRVGRKSPKASANYKNSQSELETKSPRISRKRELTRQTENETFDGTRSVLKSRDNSEARNGHEEQIVREDNEAVKNDNEAVKTDNEAARDNNEAVEAKEGTTSKECKDGEKTSGSQVSFEDSLDQLLVRLGKVGSMAPESVENEVNAESKIPVIQAPIKTSSKAKEPERLLTSLVSDVGKSDMSITVSEGKAENRSQETIETFSSNHSQFLDKDLVNAHSPRGKDTANGLSKDNSLSKSMVNGNSGLNLYDYEIFDHLGKEADYQKGHSPRNKKAEGYGKGGEKVGVYHCQFCPEKKFTSGHVWKIHMRNKHKKCNCPCGQYFETREDYLKHFYEIFPLACFVERKCPERFRSLYFQAVHHRDKHLCDRPFLCILCFVNGEEPEAKRRASFKDIKSLRIHAESMGHDPNEMFLISSKSKIDSSSLPWSMKCSGIDFC